MEQLAYNIKMLDLEGEVKIPDQLDWICHIINQKSENMYYANCNDATYTNEMGSMDWKRYEFLKSLGVFTLEQLVNYIFQFLNLLRKNSNQVETVNFFFVNIMRYA